MTLLDAKNMPKGVQRRIKKRGNMRTCCSTFVDEPHSDNRVPMTPETCPTIGAFNDKQREVLASWLRDRRDELLPDRSSIKAELGVDLVKLLMILIHELTETAP